MTVWGAVTLLTVLASADAKPKIVVVPFAVAGARADLAPVLTEVALGEFTRDGTCDVITQADLALILGFERQKQVLGCSENNTCLAELAGAMNAQYVLVGQVGRLGERLRVDFKLVETKSARVVFRQGEFSKNEDGLADVVVGLSAAMLRFLKPAGAPMPEAHQSVTPTGPSRLPAYVALGGAAALGVTALALGLTANADYQALKTQWNGGAPADPAAYATQYQQQAGSIRGRAIAADVFAVAALVAAGTGTWLLLRSPAAPAQVGLVPLDGGVLVSVGGAL